MGLEKIGMSLAQRTASWVKAAGKTSILPKPINSTQLQGLRYAPNLACDTVSFGIASVQNKIKNMCGNFLENLYGCKPNPEEIEVLFNNINRNANNDVELLMKRCKTLFETKSHLSLNICENNFNNSDFLIDNIEKINSILTRNVYRKIGPDIDKFYSALGEKELKLLASCQNDIKKLQEVIPQIIYDSTPHNISFGKNFKTVDSSDVISIISGEQSLSYFETGSSEHFENTVLKLTETSPQQGEQYYYKISEGILRQRPDLIKIVDELNTTIETSSLPIEETLANFFKSKRTSGELPKTITLQTIIPDENALILPKDTYNLFKARLE